MYMYGIFIYIWQDCEKIYIYINLIYRGIILSQKVFFQKTLNY